ncbi:MAG: class I SAM-dependent methyltransferase [Bacteroidia bacterium]|nr:class I SAM-dependent methyltransferase [Bacteroidia bacterium]
MIMTFKEILDGIDADAVKRMEKKVPQWAGVAGIGFPTRLSMEQCSSSETALYKAALASAVFQQRELATEALSSLRCKYPSSLRCGNAPSAAMPSAANDFSKPVICDLTGGLGVDCWAFSGIAAHVHHNEMNRELSAAVQHNFKALGITNASFSSIEAAPGAISGIIDACGASPDIIYLDPARRSGTGKKVFLLEDCSPDVLSLKDELLAAAPDILMKLSPMADISMVCKRLGGTVREIHVIGADGECKELLVWMQRGWDKGCTIVCGGLRFTQEEETAAVPVMVREKQALLDSGYLFEPSSVLLKSGCFNLICSRLGLSKLGKFTHLYSAAEPSEELKSYGKIFSIKEIRPFDGRSIKAVGKEWPRSEVSSRNLPISSDELRKKMGVTSGGNVHIFACAAGFITGDERIILVTSKV